MASLVAARSLLLRFLAPELKKVGERQVVDAKSRLQQVSQARFSVTPTYEVLDVSGSGHSPIFKVLVRAGGGIQAIAEGRIGIEPFPRLVQHHQERIAEKCPRQCDALALACR